MEQHRIEVTTRGYGFWLSLLTIFCFGTWACNDEKSVASKTNVLRLSFQPKAGNAALQINGNYTTPLAEPLTITAFKYYVSNITLVEANGNKQSLPDQYFLIDTKDPSSQTLLLNLPGQRYESLQFLVGVDSTRNVSGVQTGTLDPANGMFWSWNTGYIMAKLEGKSTASKAPQQGVTFHIGGFKLAESVLQPVVLRLPQAVVLGPGKTPEIVLSANALAWFSGSHNIKIADSAFCMTPGSFAQQIAANYQKSFEVVAVNN